MYAVYFSVQFLYNVPINKVQNCCIRCLSENYVQHGGPQRFDCKTEFRVNAETPFTNCGHVIQTFFGSRYFNYTWSHTYH